MHCEEALLLISGHLDNENTESEEARLQNHLKDCETCRQVLESFYLADQELLSLTEEAPEQLSERVMAAIRAEAKPKKRKNPWMTVVASAAAVALVIGLGWQAMPSEKNPAAPMMVRNVDEGLQAHSLTVTSTEAETIAQEISAPVVVLDSCVKELEGLSFETLSDGSRLYILKSGSSAQELSQIYGGTLYLPDSDLSCTSSYAIIPAQ